MNQKVLVSEQEKENQFNSAFVKENKKKGKIQGSSGIFNVVWKNNNNLENLTRVEKQLKIFCVCLFNFPCR